MLSFLLYRIILCQKSILYEDDFYFFRNLQFVMIRILERKKKVYVKKM